MEDAKATRLSHSRADTLTETVVACNGPAQICFKWHPTVERRVHKPLFLSQKISSTENYLRMKT